MAQVHLPDELAARLEQSSTSSGRSVDQVLRDIVEAHLEEEQAATAEFSEQQMMHFRDSLAEVERGEIVTSEQVDLKFETFFAKAAR